MALVSLQRRSWWRCCCNSFAAPSLAVVRISALPSLPADPFAFPRCWRWIYFCGVHHIGGSGLRICLADKLKTVDDDECAWLTFSGCNTKISDAH
jgi:hypothetical protein